MKIEGRAARKYAGALFAVAEARGLLDRAHSDLRELAQVCEQHPELMVLMRQPRIPVDRKQALLGQLFAGAIDDLLNDFVQLVAGKRRFALLPAITQEFGRLLEEYRRTTGAEATTAVEMTDAQRERLRQRLCELSGYTVLLTTRVDPEILGGLRIRMRGQLFDGSAATQLRRIREQLQQTKVTVQ